jgi:hypothetical protein
MSTGVVLGDRWAHRTQPVPGGIEDAEAVAMVPANVASDSVAAPSSIASRALGRLALLLPEPWRRSRHRRGVFGRSVMMVSLISVGHLEQS